MARASIPSTSHVNLTRSCILFHFYIKPQRVVVGVVADARCILFHFYIKPQLLAHKFCERLVVSYSISTSNHNRWCFLCYGYGLYLIPFLHQTTTRFRYYGRNKELYLIPFLHQTTTFWHFLTRSNRCILFHFYIKPQLCVIR